MTFENLKTLLERDRSVRRFDNSRSIDTETLSRLVELTRYCASGRNLQPLKYLMINDPHDCEQMYPLMKWAGYLSDWDGPVPAERPTAYLVQCLDTDYGESLLCDDGLQLQAITLGAIALGIGGCIIKSFNAPKLKEIFGLDPNLEPRYVLALGYPVEEIVIEDTVGTKDADIKYYRTPDGVHHVPKRPLAELTVPKAK